MMKKIIFVSISFNIIFLLIGAFVIYEKEDSEYLKKSNQNKPTQQSIEKKENYIKARKEIFEVMPNTENEIIFLGNSITTNCPWHEFLGKSNIKNRGIRGDDIHGVTNRLDEVTSSRPKKIFLMIGINDLAKKRSVSQILTEYEKLVIQIIEKTPKTELYIQSVLPTDNRKRLQNKDIIKINYELIKLAKKHNLTYINLFDLFKTNENNINTDLTFDGVHLNRQGYLLWKNAIIGYVNK